MVHCYQGSLLRTLYKKVQLWGRKGAALTVVMNQQLSTKCGSGYSGGTDGRSGCFLEDGKHVCKYTISKLIIITINYTHEFKYIYINQSLHHGLTIIGYLIEVWG